MKKNNSAKSVLGILSTWIFLYPISIVTGIMIARELGPQGKGIYSFANLWSSFLLPLANLGFPAGVLYYISSEEFSFKDTAFSAILISLIIGALLSSILFVLWRFKLMGEIAKEITFHDISGICGLLIINSGASIIYRLSRGIGWFGLMNFLNILQRIILLFFLIVIVIVAKMGATGAIYASLIANIFSVGIVSVLLFKRYSVKLIINYRFIREAFHYGFKAYWANIASTANARIDQFILSIYVSARGLGLYSVAANLSELPWVVTQAISPVLFKKIAVKKDTYQKIVLTETVLKAVMMSLSLVFLLIWLLSDQLISKLYGRSFLPSAKLIRIYLPGAAIYVSTKIFSKFFSASGKPELTSLYQSIGVVIGLISYSILIPKYGIYGAAWGTFLSYVFTSIIAYYLYIHTIKPFKSSLFSIKKRDIIWIREQLRDAIK